MRRELKRSSRVFIPRAVKGPDDEALPDGVCGRVMGQACTYNTLDDYGTFFRRGAFDRSRAEKVPAGKVGLFRDHDHVSSQHVGVIRSLDDVGNGVMMTADFFDTPEGRDAKQYVEAVLKAKGSTGLSVGVYPRDGHPAGRRSSDPQAEPGKPEPYGFDEVELAEISITPFPAVPGADVLHVRKEAKTKRVDGEDLTASDFIIARDKDDPSTWKLPWHFSTEEKTKSHLRNALARFNQTEGATSADKAKLERLCRQYGIDVSDAKDDEDEEDRTDETPSERRRRAKKDDDDGDEDGEDGDGEDPDDEERTDEKPKTKRKAKEGESNDDDDATTDPDDEEPAVDPQGRKHRTTNQQLVLRALLTSMCRADILDVALEFGLVDIRRTTHTGPRGSAPAQRKGPRLVDEASRLAFLREHIEDAFR
jgi:HK97 family phage prohead protease